MPDRREGAGDGSGKSKVVPMTKEVKVAKKEEVKVELPAMPRLPRARKAKPKRPCACGCGAETTGTYAPGHDSYLRGWKLRVERGLVKLSDVPEAQRPAVKRLLNAAKEADSKEA